MLRPWLSPSAIVLALLLVCPVGAQAGAGKGQSGGLLTAYLDGRSIEMGSVSSYHCHDLEAPVIRCFDNEKKRDADNLAASGYLQSEGMLSVTSVTYVLWYDNSNYGGASFSASGPIPNLATLNWDNRISSFKSTNGGHPKWWDGTSYGGSAWQWATSAWVWYVGDSRNDRFTSVKNVP